MGNIKLYENLLGVLEQKVPKKSELVTIVTDTLRIEKESAYRRLRGEIPFTLNEAGTIASHMGISIDELIYNGKTGNSGLTYMSLPIYSNRYTYNDDSLKTLVNYFKEISSHPDSEHGVAANIVPSVAYLPHKNLFRFLMFKWSHRYGDPTLSLKYSDSRFTEEGLALQDELMGYYTNIDHTVCILDISIIENIIRDIKYFINIRFISREDVETICQDIFALIDQMQYITQYGKFPSSGNKFDIYLSDISLGTTYSYASGGPVYISSFTAFVIQLVLSTQKDTYLKIKDWVDYIRKMSTYVTMVSVKESVRFMDKQRRTIEEFLDEIRQEDF